MASIEIKNVGPSRYRTNRLGRFNVIIGKQSTGKSTFMKNTVLLSMAGEEDYDR